MSSPFQRIFSAKTPFRHNHGNENARSFGGYDPETGEIIDARTGRTPSQQQAINLALEQKQVEFPDEYAAYQDARNAYMTWQDNLEPEFLFGGKEYPQQAELDSVTDVWRNIKNQVYNKKAPVDTTKVKKLPPNIQ